MVQIRNAGTAKSFLDYAGKLFLPFVSANLQNTTRVDTVWDEYQTVSLKCTTRQKGANVCGDELLPLQ